MKGFAWKQNKLAAINFESAIVVFKTFYTPVRDYIKIEI